MKHIIQVDVYRQGSVESRHTVVASIVDYLGVELQSYGQSDFSVYLRSAAKPFQALSSFESGAVDSYGLTSQEIAVATASHLGHDIHTQAVRHILQKGQIEIQYLQNCEHEDISESAYSCQKSSKNELQLLQHNCSGKHAAFLLTQKKLGGDLQDYLKPSGFAQDLVLKIFKRLLGSQENAVRMIDSTLAPDGCGSPIFQLPLNQMALLYAQLGAGVHPEYASALQKIYESMSTHPEYVRGLGDFNTDLIQAFQGRLVAKLGYEGVYGVALQNGVGVALKVLDGHVRALAPAVMCVLKTLFSSDDSAFQHLEKWNKPTLYNIHKVPVGFIHAQVVRSLL